MILYCPRSSSHKTGLDHHIMKVASKHHLKDWRFVHTVIKIQASQREGLDIEHQKKGRAEVAAFSASAGIAEVAKC